MYSLLLAVLTLGTPFKDKLVLQRDMPVPVWGWAEPGEKVTVSFAGHTVSGTAGKDGKWMVRLPKLKACAENRVMKVNDVTVKDVLVGEVWFCSGQSNTELPLIGWHPHFTDREGRMVAQLTREPQIRYAFCSSYTWSTTPKATLECKDYPCWKEFNKENLVPWPSFSAMGVYFALQLHHSLDVPVGIVGAYWGGTNIDAWTPRSGYAGKPRLKETAAFKVVSQEEWKDEMKKGPINEARQQPCVLWNEMLAPWTPFAAKGLIWYQGCNNQGEGDLYCDKMHALYDGWAKEFENPNLKLYFAQLAPWIQSWWGIQMAQQKFADEEPNAGLVPTCDIGNNADIHPNEKGTLGRRLAALALQRDYGWDDIVADAPKVVKARAVGREVVIDCDHVKSWLLYNWDWDVAHGFEIKDENGQWHKALFLNANDGNRSKNPFYTIGKVEGREIHLAADNVWEPKGVRYLHEHPWSGFLYADSGLPLGPFIREWQ